MLQFTLARDELLVGYGSTAKSDVTLIPKKANSERGCRPALFVGPSRDAHALICRKIHSVFILRPKVLRDSHPRLFVFNFPESEHVNPEPWITAAHLASAGQGFVQNIQLSQISSTLSPNADVVFQSFAPHAVSSELAFLHGLKLNIQAFVSENTLHEQFTLSGIDADAFEAFVLHWHEPEIGMSNRLMTTYSDVKNGALISFRGPVWFGVSAHQLGNPCSVAFFEIGEIQHQRSALKRLQEIYGSMSQSDLVLGFHHSGLKKTTPENATTRIILPILTGGDILLGQTDGLMVWQINPAHPFAMETAVAEKKETMERRLQNARTPNGFENEKAKVTEADRNWLAGLKPLSPAVAQKWGALYSRTLLTLRQMQDPDGGIIAAPEFHYEFTHCGGYGYCWGRDAGFISLAMDVCGMHAESAKFYKYMSKCQSENGSFLHRHDMQGNLGSSWGFLQPDETGSVLFGFWQHVKQAKNRNLALELKDMVVAGAHWLCQARFGIKNDVASNLPISGIDLWEEREGIHLYSVAAMIAGVQAAVDLSVFMGWEIPQNWHLRLKELRDLINSEVFISSEKGTPTIVRTLLRKLSAQEACTLRESGIKILESQDSETGRFETRLESDFVVDISLLGISVPFEALDESRHPKLLSDLVERMDACLWTSPSGGMLRYEGDKYRNGNPWILTTFWFALAAAKANNLELARKAFLWAANSSAPEGMFSEQIDPVSGQPNWVMPLTWSHAMFALAVQELPPSVTAP